MTALSLAYPFAALWYFWHDWIKYATEAAHVWVGRWGVAVPVNDWMVTLLSPWRVALAAVTAKLLFSSANKLRKGEPNAKALSLLTLFGLVLPQSIWLFEFVNDWRGGEGLGTVAAVMAAIAAVPALLMSVGKKSALSQWGALDESMKGRVMGAAVGMGWLGMAAMSLVDHSYQVRGPTGAFGAAIATMLLSVLSMVGLFKQKSWGLLTSIGAVGAAGAGAVALSNAHIVEGGTAIDGAFATVADAPVLSAAVPALVLLALLRPFFTGMAKKVAGVDADAHERSESTRVRVATDGPIADHGEPIEAVGASVEHRAHERNSSHG